MARGDPEGVCESVREVIAVGFDRMTPPEFMRRVADWFETPEMVTDPEFARLADLFVGGGLPALSAADRNVAWLQYRLCLRDAPTRELYDELITFTQSALADDVVKEFFFVHKQPGMRVRFQIEIAARRALDAAARDWLTALRDGCLIADWQAGVYEPESYLFGGATSMRSVHRIFTADSMAWLRFHASTVPLGPAWAMSLLMVRGLFDALGIGDWEDVDVWNQVRDWGCRRLPPGTDAVEPAQRALRRAWCEPARLPALLHPWARELVDHYRNVLETECSRWWADYFMAVGADVGPRAAAALIVMFHWNRARLSTTWQAVVTEALARHPAVGDET
jgi:thiopeptide-type bacteriocin biosynthesis protein